MILEFQPVAIVQEQSMACIQITDGARACNPYHYPQLLRIPLTCADSPAVRNVRDGSFPTRQGWQMVAGASFGGKGGRTTTGTASNSQRTPEGCQKHRRSQLALKRRAASTPPGCGFIAPLDRWSAPFALADAPATFWQPSGLRHGGGAAVTSGLIHQKRSATERKDVYNDKVCNPQQLRQSERGWYGV